MKVCYLICIVLSVLLLSSNVWWVYRSIDGASVAKYREQMLYESVEALEQTIALLPGVAGQTSREDIVEAAETVAETEAFEKDGRVWVGWLGFKFEEGGKLESVIPNFDIPGGYVP